MKNEPLLSVDKLQIAFPHQGNLHTVVDQISFTLNQGEILGIAGESGSGKSMSALAVMGLLPKAAKIMGGQIHFAGKELIGATPKEMRELKGTQMAMIFQEPMTSFNPVHTVGKQVEEMLRLHQKCSPKEYKEKTLSALSDAGLDDAENVYHKYPHQLSGGMRQRAMIAMAMIAGPKLLIADEPTTALDVSIQDKILKLLKKINQDYGTSIILVSHDLGVIQSICENVLIMKAGKIIETGKAKDIFNHPQTDYTKLLVAAAPASWSRQIRKTVTGNKETIEASVAPSNLILSVKDLNVFYQENSGSLFGGRLKKHIVKNVSLFVNRGETFGIVGESGCGKSTLAKAIAGLIKDADGDVIYSDKTTKAEDRASIRPQMVFQDPYSSLNPVKKIGWILEEPLRINGHFTKKERKRKVKEMIKQVGLEEKYLGRYVSQLSGGQRQRVAIAAAVILNPELIILDEPVSALDVTVQSQILFLLKELQQQYHLSYLFISHDLNVIYQVCDRVCVMYQGEIVETKETNELFSNPQQNYTKELLQASLPVNV